MKVKHLLFSSLFLSAGFAACTSEVDEFNTQAPSTPVKGYEMKDLKISVTNGEFETDAETRAELNEKWAASWQEGDRLGAAMYSMTSVGKNSETGNLEATGDAFDMYKDKGIYGSNSWFEYVNGTADEFATTATCMAGAYVLYYPYNAAKTYDLDQVRVVTKDGMANEYNGLPTTMTFDSEDITAAVNKNIFAANVVSFIPGGSALTEFTVKQIPNLYGLTFKIKDESLLSLKEKVTILSVIMEAKNSTGTVLSCEGYVSPEKTQPTKDEFNNAPVNINDLSQGYRNIGGIKYTSEPGKAPERIIIDASEATQADEAYQITALGEATQPYFFSALPVGADVESVKFSVIVKAGNETKVFSKTYTSSYTGWNDMDLDDVAGAETPGLKSLVTGMGQVVKLPVALDIVENNDEDIFTTEQFATAWEAAKEKTSGTVTFNMARPMDLSEYDLTGLDEDVTAKFTGDTIIVNNVEGKFQFEKAVRIKGNLKTTGASSFAANTYVEGNFEAAGNTTFSARADIAGTVTANANVTFSDSNKAKTGIITVAAGKTLVAKNENNDIAGINVNGTANVNGKIGAVKVENGANLTSEATAVASTLTVVDGTVSANVFTAENADIQIEGNFTATGNFNITNKMAVAGNATAEKVNKIKTLEVGSNAVVAVTGVTYGTPVTAPSIETVTVKAGTNNKGDLTVNDITLGNVTNNGKISANNVTVATKFDNNFQFSGNAKVSGTFNQEGDIVKVGKNASEITVNESGTFNVNKNATIKLINNGIVNVKGVYDKNDNFTAYATLTVATKSVNNKTINVRGNLIEEKANCLTQGENSYINVFRNATFALASSTTYVPDASAVVELMDKEKATFTNASTPVAVTVAYTWSSWSETVTNAPANSAINTIFVAGVPAKTSVIDVLKDYNLIFKSNFALEANMTMADGKSVTIAENVTISSNKADENRILSLNGENNKILKNKKLTLTDQVYLTGTASTKITTESGASIVAKNIDKDKVSISF